MKFAGELLDILRRPNASLPVDPRRQERVLDIRRRRGRSPVGKQDHKVRWVAIARIGGPQWKAGVKPSQMDLAEPSTLPLRQERNR